MTHSRNPVLTYLMNNLMSLNKLGTKVKIYRILPYKLSMKQELMKERQRMGEGKIAKHFLLNMKMTNFGLSFPK